MLAGLPYFEGSLGLLILGRKECSGVLTGSVVYLISKAACKEILKIGLEDGMYKNGLELKILHSEAHLLCLNSNKYY